MYENKFTGTISLRADMILNDELQPLQSYLLSLFIFSAVDIQLYRSWQNKKISKYIDWLLK